MIDVRYTSKFKKDFKTCVKRNYNMELLKQVVDTLRIPDKLPEKNDDHKLLGAYEGYRECHVAPNWLLIYRQNDTELELHRTGTHADLFNM